jgi:hypothetical protein
LPSARRTFITCKNTFQNAHDAEISSFFAQPDLAAGCAFCAPGVSKTPVAVTASQPEIASGSAMIVDLASKKIIYQPAGSGSPDGVDHQSDDRDGGA